MPLHVAKGFFPLLALVIISACTPIVATGSTAANLVTLQDRSVGTTIDDSTIYGRITDALVTLDSKEAYRGIAVEVSEGRVLLTGQVKDATNAEKAIKAAWSVPGVREVINEVQVVPGSNSPLVYANDSIVTAQAKSRLIAARGIASSNYNIETVNGIVYVMGVARDEAEHKRAMNIISRAMGARKVISHVRVMHDPDLDEMPDIIPASVPPL